MPMSRYTMRMSCAVEWEYFCPFPDPDAMNERAQEFRGQLVDRPEALCLFDKGIDICRRCFQLLQPLRFRWDRFLRRFLFRIAVSRQPSGRFAGDTAKNIVLIEPLERSGQFITSALHTIHIFLQRIDLMPKLRTAFRRDAGRALPRFPSGEMGDSAQVIQNDLFQGSLSNLMRHAESLSL